MNVVSTTENYTLKYSNLLFTSLVVVLVVNQNHVFTWDGPGAIRIFNSVVDGGSFVEMTFENISNDGIKENRAPLWNCLRTEYRKNQK